MKLQKKMFNYYDTGIYAHQKRISYYGWEGKGIQAFYNYIVGYINASNAIYNSFIQAAENGDISTQDTIGFPLCFNYRQSIELYLKYFYLKYVSKNNDDFIIFLHVSHNLASSWNKIKPTLQNLLQRQESSISLNQIEEYLLEWHNFDNKSFTMRYPINKLGEATHKSNKRLDIVNLKQNMDNFYDIMSNIDSTIDNQMVKFPLDKRLEQKIRIIYSNCKPNITEIICLLTNENSDKLINTKYRDYFYSLDVDFQVLLGLLYFSARDVITGRCKLAIDLTDKKIDFYKIIITNMNEVNLKFDDNQSDFDEVFNYLFCNNPKKVIETLNLAKSLMEL